MTPPPAAIARLIELARWAPSGDNTQPWRFEILHADRFLIHAFDTRDHCVYDLDGHPSQVSVGALIETLHIAATGLQLTLSIERRSETSDKTPVFDVRLAHAPSISPDPLLPHIPRRSVCRLPLRTRPLSTKEMHILSSALPPGYHLQWHTGWAGRSRMAGLMYTNAKLRLTMHEAFEVHRAIIDWGQRFSTDRVPDQALGADAATLKLMRWAMADWRRIRFMNRWLGGTIAPRLQMDLLPSLLCAAHVAIVADTEPSSIDDHVAGGRAVQRLWLTATALGLQHQPEMTPLIFARYIRQRRDFTEDVAAQALAASLAVRSQALLGDDLPKTIWLGRLGEGRAASSRSLRKGFAELCTGSNQFQS